MSGLMDYGPDWPPAPEPAEPKRRGLSLWQRCAAAVVFYGLLWVAASLILAALLPSTANLNFRAPAGEGHTTDVTTTLPPHPIGDQR